MVPNQSPLWSLGLQTWGDDSSQSHWKEKIAHVRPPFVRSCKAKSNKDSKPLRKGCFPASERGLPVQALLGMLSFNHTAQVEPEIEKLLPGNKSSFNLQGRLSEENMRSLERDLRINLSSLSYVLCHWNRQPPIFRNFLMIPRTVNFYTLPSLQ